MRYISTLSFILILFFSYSTSAQESVDVRLGEILTIGDANNYQYSDVKFPKPNFIIKKGGIANYKKLRGTLVEITEIRTNRKKETIIVLKRKDGKKFFGSFQEIKANYNDAISSGELIRI